MFTEKNFAKLQFNPLCKKAMLKEYPALCQIIRPEISDTADLDKLLRYTIMLCEPKSVLVLSERDLNYRKELAADLAELKEDEDYRQSVFTYSNDVVLELTMRYLKRFSKSKEWSAIIALETTYWEGLRLLLKPINDSEVKDKDVLDAVQKKSAIKNEIDTDLKRIETYYAAFFGEDKELIDKKERITPENIRKNLKR